MAEATRNELLTHAEDLCRQLHKTFTRASERVKEATRELARLKLEADNAAKRWKLQLEVWNGLQKLQ